MAPDQTSEWQQTFESAVTKILHFKHCPIFRELQYGKEKITSSSGSESRGAADPMVGGLPSYFFGEEGGE